MFQGAFGTVSLVRKKDTGAYYALKMLNKKEVSSCLEFNPKLSFKVVQRKQIAHVKAERDILKEADNDWIVKLYYRSLQVSNKNSANGVFLVFKMKSTFILH